MQKSKVFFLVTEACKLVLSACKTGYKPTRNRGLPTRARPDPRVRVDPQSHSVSSIWNRSILCFKKYKKIPVTSHLLLRFIYDSSLTSNIANRH